MPIHFGKDSLLKEEQMLRRMSLLIDKLLNINLERQLRIQEADEMSHD